eukprot:GHVL01022874.1.p1 GENE.GHVL01022874.1~~GHVL01022874.1.p1  ORF type:complete len:409 (+),score=57.13 GHVL01022874.1:60-1286(+)
MPDFVIGCVGKPSAGKSTFFNSVTDGNAKVGNYPFTTIEPNEGIGYYTTECPCKRFNVQCRPRYGSCINGRRKIPVKLLDVAGLIPGASEGHGLGNKFLDNLRLADIFLHILDVSGTTNEMGAATIGYNPELDHEWLKGEICSWIFQNIWSKWGSIAKKHQSTNSSVSQTLLNQLSGYGARLSLVEDVTDKLGLSDPVELKLWDKDMVNKMVELFVDHRFRFLLVLNKSDMETNETDKNILRLTEKYSDVVIASALAECFLKKMVQQEYIEYEDDEVFTYPERDNLKPLDEKLRRRINKIQDMVLFRHGSTGVNRAINRAVEMCGLIVAYPVKYLPTECGQRSSKIPFQECKLIKKETTVRQLAKLLHVDIDKNYGYAEGPNGLRIGEDELITDKNNIIKYVKNTVRP